MHELTVDGIVSTWVEQQVGPLVRRPIFDLFEPDIRGLGGCGCELGPAYQCTLATGKAMRPDTTKEYPL